MKSVRDRYLQKQSNKSEFKGERDAKKKLKLKRLEKTRGTNEAIE